MKKILMIALCLLLGMSAAACSGQAPPAGGAPAPAGGGVSGSENGGDADAQALRLEMSADTYPLTAEELPYKIVNETGQTQKVVLAPQLQKKDGDQWTDMACEAGFCGNPDSVKDEFEFYIRTEWYPELTAGAYRLTLNTEDYDGAETISDEFTLE